MNRKFLLMTLVLFTFSTVGSAVLVAQSAPVTGTVELHKDDGSKEPVSNALIEVYRMDIKSSFPSAKTNKRGEFSFAGLPLGATFYFSVSAAGASPLIYPNVRAGQERLVLIMSPGDGRKLTEDDVRKAAAAAQGAEPAKAAELTEAQKKEQAEYEAKVKEIEEKNKKAAKTNEIINAALKEGNEAFKAKNYDLAVAKYEEGIAADPEFVGSAPTFYNNRGAALYARGIDTYNAGIKMTDATEKFAAFTKAKKDFDDAAQGYLKAWIVLRNAPAADINDKSIYEATRIATLRGAKDAFQIGVRTEQVDESMIESAKVLIPEYLKIETDAAKELEARVVYADLFRVVGDSDNAIAAYTAILEEYPDNQDALAGAGLSLVNLGYINNDKAKLQEGANLLQRFASVAPDSHKFKADAVALIDTLKKESNVTPQKRAAPSRRRP